MLYLTPSWRRLVSSDRTCRNDVFERHLREVTRPTQIRFTKMMRACNGQPVGFEFRHASREEWCVILPEPVPDGAEQTWRSLTFDRRGLHAHSAHKSVDVGIEQAIHAGFQDPDPGALDKVSAEPLWGIAQAQHDCRDQFFKKLISMEQYMAEMNAIALRHGLAEVPFATA